MDSRKDYEKEIDLRCMVEFKLLGRNVGAYLLERKGRYALRFGFDTEGIKHYLPPHQQNAALDNLAKGIRSTYSIPGLETLRIRQRNLNCSSAKVTELESTAIRQKNQFLQLLILAQSERVWQLDRDCHRLNYSTEIFTTYGNEFEFDESWSETLLRRLNKGYRHVKASYRQELHQQLEPFLLEGFERYLQWERILEKRFKLKTKTKTWQQLWELAELEFNATRLGSSTHLLKVTEKNGELDVDEDESELSARSILIRGEKVASIPKASYEWMKIKGEFVAAVVLERKLEGYEDQFNFFWNVLKETPNCEIAWEIFPSNTTLDRVNLVRTIRGAKSLKQLSEKYGSEGTQSELEIEDAKAAQTEIASNKKTFKLSVVFFVYRKNLKELKKACEDLSNNLPLGVAVREDANVHELWRNKQPFNWKPLLGTLRRQTYIDAEIAAPIVCSRGYEKRRGLELYDAVSKSPFLINYIDENHNSLVIAQKRKGKTSLILEKLLIDLIEEIPSMFLDYGMVEGRTTCSDLVDLLGPSLAENVEMGITGCNILRLPIDDRLSQKARQQRAIVYQNSLIGFLERVVLENGVKSDSDSDLIRFLNLGVEQFFEAETIKSRYEEARRSRNAEPIAIDLIEFLENIEKRVDLDFAIDEGVKQRVVYKLRMFFATRLGKSFSDRFGFDFTIPFLNFSLRGAKNSFEKTIAAMATQILANARAMAYEKTRVTVDEGSLLLKDSIVADSIAEHTVNGGKSGQIVDLISQEVQSIVNCSAAAQFKENLDHKLIGAVSASNQETLAEFLSVEPSALDLNTTSDFDPDPSRLVTHWTLFDRNDRIHLIHCPSAHFLASIASNPAEQKARSRYLKAYSSPVEAILEFGKDYYLAKKNGIAIETLKPPELKR